MRLAVVALCLMLAGSNALAKAAGHRSTTKQDAIANAASLLGFTDARQLAASRIYDGMFNALQPILGGTAPRLNYVASLPQGANGQAHPGQDMIDIDQATLAALVDENSPLHSGAVNVLPHELAHMRQTSAILAALADREGGAQAFADEVSPTAAYRAGTYYDAGRNYDGAYKAYADAARKRGRDWLFAGQFGKSVTPTWP